MTDKLIFDQVISHVSPESVKKIQEIKKEFYTLTDDYSKELAGFNAKHMYKFE